MDIHVIYPDDYRIDEATARIWLCDAIANQEVDDPLLTAKDAENMPIEDVVKCLNDTGNVTLIFVQPHFQHRYERMYP